MKGTSAAKGAVLNPDIKIAFGVLLGSAITSYGRCFIKGQQPDSSKCFLTSAAPNLSSFANLWTTALSFPSAIMDKAVIRLLAPRSILASVPLTGETNFISELAFE